MAPSTPPPPRRDELAAFTMASTSSVVMSARRAITSITDILPLARSCADQARSHHCSYTGGIDPCHWGAICDVGGCWGPWSPSRVEEADSAHYHSNRERRR